MNVSNNTIEKASRWTPEQAQEWSRTLPWLCGFNFLPSSAVNSTEMWQASTWDEATVARELSWAQEIGFNCCRVFLQFLVWNAEEEALLTRFERFLQLADERGLKVMPILFDDCAFSGRAPYLGQQDEPVPGVHNSGWTASPGFERADDLALWPRLRAYVHAFINRFASDERIVLWDIYNEPGNSERGDRSLSLLRASFAWAREASPSQPISSGLWHHHDTLQGCNEFMEENSDVLTFHDYGTASQTRAWIEDLKPQGRPILCTEWMARTLDSRFDSHLPLFHQENVGCFFWGLVSGRTHTHWPWNSEKGAPPPDLWFHDLLTPDGKPYREEEVALLKSTLAKAKTNDYTK